MRRRWWTVIAIPVAGGLLLAGGLALRLHQSGFGASVPAVGGPCVQVALAGAEDMTFDRDGVLWISATDRRAGLEGRPVSGGLYRYDPRSAELTAVPVDGPPGLHPHGLDLLDGTLAVVNHPTPTTHTVELYDVRPDGSLAHRRTVAGLHSPNDVTLVGPDTLYVSHDHGAGPALTVVEDLLGARWAWVELIDGTSRRPVIGGLSYANGVQATPDGSTVYVSETLGRRVRTYARGPDGSLTLQRTMRLDVSPDNLELAPDGAVWAGAHPDIIAYLRHAADGSVRSPSAAVRIGPDGSVSTEWSDPGDRLSGSSVAAVHGDILALGAVFSPHMLICER